MSKEKHPTKKSKKKYHKKQHSSARDHYTVVLEDLRSQFRVFGEGLDYVSDTLDKHTKELQAISERSASIELRLANIEMDLALMKEELAVIRHSQVTREEFKLLETRVRRIERLKR